MVYVKFHTEITAHAAVWTHQCFASTCGNVLPKHKQQRKHGEVRSMTWILEYENMLNPLTRAVVSCHPLWFVRTTRRIRTVSTFEIVPSLSTDASALLHATHPQVSTSWNARPTSPSCAWHHLRTAWRGAHMDVVHASTWFSIAGSFLRVS